MVHTPRRTRHRPTARFRWHYDHKEIFADGVVHAIGICLGLIGATVIILMAAQLTTAVGIASVWIYTIALVAMLGFSAAYNMWPVCETKWMLRRFDHSAIYLLIAGTYTPFITQLKNVLSSGGMLMTVWLTAAAGITLNYYCQAVLIG